MINEEEGKEGLKIDHVFPAGPAARGGLQPGDVITKVNDKP